MSQSTRRFLQFLNASLKFSHVNRKDTVYVTCYRRIDNFCTVGQPPIHRNSNYPLPARTDGPSPLYSYRACKFPREFELEDGEEGLMWRVGVAGAINEEVLQETPQATRSRLDQNAGNQIADSQVVNIHWWIMWKVSSATQ